MERKIFAIGDLHLPGGDKKPMDIFGEHWRNHFERISEDWWARVRETDIVLIPGDISWAMYLEDAVEDLKRIAELPGTILILRGNHDYWWNSLTQLRCNLPPNMFAVQNDAMCIDDVVFAGTRGWVIPTELKDGDKNTKIYKREIQRLELSLSAAKKLSEGRTIISMMHYPPIGKEWLRSGTGFTDLMTSYGVKCCVYGHLHGACIPNAFSGMYRGVCYELVSCDALGFRLKEITLE